MRYKLLGRTGLRVSEAALGSGTIGTGWGWGAEEGESRAIFDAFAEAGGNFIDSADGYQGGQAERFLGEFIRSDRDSFVISTKYSGGGVMNGPLTKCGNSRKAMTQSLEGSLKRFGVECIDLFYVHFSDAVTPTEEIMAGLEDVVRQGKALYIGFSNFPAWRIARAATLAECLHLPKVAAIEIEYSLVERTPERELLPMAEGLGIGVTLWAILGGGLLTGKYRRQGEGRLTHGGGRVLVEADARATAILDALEAVAKEMGVAVSQAAIGWVRAKAKRRTTSLIPILGARTLTQMTENLAALDFEMPAELVACLDEVSAVPAGYPHEWLDSDSVRGLATAGKADLIDPPNYPVA